MKERPELLKSSAMTSCDTAVEQAHQNAHSEHYLSTVAIQDISQERYCFGNSVSLSGVSSDYYFFLLMITESYFFLIIIVEF